jgi:hypothetical protein
MMERGPFMLFGAIIAVGLGPAMWLGAQFGQTAIVPPAPPALVVETDGNAAGGAGAATDTLETDAGTGPADVFIPLSATPSARPSSDRPEVIPVQTSSPAATPSPSGTTPSRSTAPSTPPTESTTSPSTGPTGDDTEEPTSPATLPPTEEQGSAAGSQVSPPVV